MMYIGETFRRPQQDPQYESVVRQENSRVQKAVLQLPKNKRVKEACQSKCNLSRITLHENVFTLYTQTS